MAGTAPTGQAATAPSDASAAQHHRGDHDHGDHHHGDGHHDDGRHDDGRYDDGRHDDGRDGGHGAGPAGRHDGHDHAGHDHAGHDHAVRADADARYLAVAIGLILAIMGVEVVVALLDHSVALLADAGHMVTDAAALGASLWTVHLVRRPASDAMTYGLHRAEILSAAVNGVTLVVIGVVVAVEAVARLLHPAPVHGAALIVVAGAGVVVNAAATAVLARANRASLNIAGAFAHLLTDVWAFAATLVAGVVIVATGWRRADPVASLVVVVLMARTAWPLLRSAGRILLEGAPEGVDLADVRAHLLAVDHVRAVHDLHAWVVTSHLPAVSAHVVVADEAFADGGAPRILDQLQACLAGHFDVAHSTFQLEPAGHVDHEVAPHA